MSESEVEVLKIIKEGDKVTGIETTEGFVRSDQVILAAGVGSRYLAKTIGLDIPFQHRRKYVLVISGFECDFPVTMEVPTGWVIKKRG